MKNKTKKTLVVWAVGLLYSAAVGVLTWAFDVNLGLTAFPAIVSALGWVLTKVLAVCSIFWK